MKSKLFYIAIGFLSASIVMADINKRQEVFFWDYGDKTSATINRVLNMKKDVDNTTFVLSGGSWAVTNNITFPTNCALRVQYGSSFAVDNGSTVALPSVLFDALDQVVFTGAGSATGDALFFYRWPNWGNTTNFAIGDGVLSESQVETWIENGDLTFAGGTTQRFDNAIATNLTATTANLTDVTATGTVTLSGSNTMSGTLDITGDVDYESGSTLEFKDGSVLTHESGSTNTYEDGSIMNLSSGSVMNVSSGAAVQGEGWTNSIESVITTSTNITVLLTPAGTVISSFATATPEGYLYCDGTSYETNAQPELFAAIGYSCGSTNAAWFNVPDLEGQFLRGHDPDGVRDPDAGTRSAMATGGNSTTNVGSVQSFAMQTHTHGIESGTTSTATYPTRQENNGGVLHQTSGMTGNTANETRPINVYVRYYIKN